MDHSNHKMDNSNKLDNSNPCTDTLTDAEFLEHMIPHHQVAIDMSLLLQPNTTSDIILNLCREIIRKQQYEIIEMTYMKKYDGELFSDDPWEKENIITKLDKYNPILSKSKDDSQHMKGMKITEKSYLEHMIPHHQVAIDMSQRLLLHTNNSYLLDFCRKLIIDQQGEIYYMNNRLDSNNYLYKSELLR